MESAKEIVIRYLEDLDVCIPNSDENEFTVRCPYCGDSANPTHAHLGILIERDEDDMPMIWNCFKCGEGGRLTEEVLNDLGIVLSEDEHQTLVRYDRKMSKLANSRRSIVRMARYRVPSEPSNSALLKKLDYIQERIGKRIDVASNKIVLSLSDFLAFNEIEKVPGLKPYTQRVLDAYYVGFLSSNNNNINFRCTVDNPKLKRYFQLVLNPYMEDNVTFYSIPAQLDLLYTGPLRLNIAEGVFDILSIRHNVIQDHGGQQLFYAACGYSYIKIIKHLARSGIITNIDAHIYADKDKSDRAHLKMINDTSAKEFLEHFTIHRNSFKSEKDFGVPPDRIEESARKFW